MGDYSSRKYKRDLETDRFPRICVLAPSRRRLEVVRAAIVGAKKYYTSSSTDNVTRMPFWLATFDQVEVNSIDQGFVSRKPLDSVWVNEAGNTFPSPFMP